MLKSSEKVYYGLVFDTGSYSGNFEREMASYVTGLEFARGQEYLNPITPNFSWWEDNKYVTDTSEFQECVEIWPTPGYVNNGIGKHFREDSQEAKDLLHKWPAYQSVIIFVRERPNEYVIADAVVRAKDFCKNFTDWKKKPTPIEYFGHRLIKFKVIETEEEIT